MPKHLGIDANILAGTVTLKNAKVISVMFIDSKGQQMTFVKSPRIGLTLMDTSTNPPYKTNDIKSGDLFTGFILGFQAPVSIDVEWSAQER